MVVSNHPSWWDPILFMLLHRAAFDGRPIYGPIDAAMLEKYRFFGRLGAFGVEQGTRRLQRNRREDRDEADAEVQRPLQVRPRHPAERADHVEDRRRRPCRPSRWN